MSEFRRDVLATCYTTRAYASKSCTSNTPPFLLSSLYDKHPDEYMAVLAGATGKVDEKGGRLYNIESVVKHPKLMDGEEMNQAYDLAIITVDQDFEFNDKVQAIQIAKKKVKANRGKAVGGGWGVRSVSNTTTPPCDKVFPNDVT